MDRLAADSLLAEADLVPALEGPVPSAKELERRLLDHDIPVRLARPPEKACCSPGGCGCAQKLQLLVRPSDVQRITTLLQQDWLDALRREGTVDTARLTAVPSLSPEAAPGEEGPLTCPACGFQGDLVEGACGDCGLQLE